ncbi:hypothetical protein AVEN_195080-1 [Araneus ventricosus]|uniref:Uncharacterized protein n=1 Tax=Araneus ventricosus TaxID=182803 RepID=A0A4Y2BJ28_ARAVE|nr:hypothetical protein AVEN_195080-1 [Araneus ventricosus]
MPTNKAELQWNRVLNLERSGSEAERSPLGHRGPTNTLNPRFVLGFESENLQAEILLPVRHVSSTSTGRIPPLAKLFVQYQHKANTTKLHKKYNFEVTRIAY